MLLRITSLIIPHPMKSEYRPDFQSWALYYQTYVAITACYLYFSVTRLETSLREMKVLRDYLDLPEWCGPPYSHWFDGHAFAPPFCINCGNLTRSINCQGEVYCTCGVVKLRCGICRGMSCESFCVLCGTHSDEYGLECSCWDEVRQVEELWWSKHSKADE